MEKLLFELAWKEYFLRVWENKMDDIWTDLKHPASYSNTQIPSNIVDANTGINTIDSAIEELYQTGYMHNHARMWTASLVTNIAKSYWKIPSQWMYYHLLDGDIASNTLSWQWVSGTFSSKKYFANQENINKYSKTNQYNTFFYISFMYLIMC
ncbi:MAG: FAD-binding domain-containing protein, partial [Minisyncoccia bacterium]